MVVKYVYTFGALEKAKKTSGGCGDGGGGGDSGVPVVMVTVVAVIVCSDRGWKTRINGMLMR